MKVLITRARQIALLLRLTAFDTSTESGRSQERYRRVALTTMASTSAKIVGVLTTLIAVPLTVTYLGPERYGLWMTISSVVAMFAFADLGLANGLLNAISEANGKDDRGAACQYVSSAFVLLSGIALLLGIGFMLVYSYVPWAQVFNVSSPDAVAESGPTVAVLVGCLLVNIPLGVVQRVQFGYQDGFTSGLWMGLGSLLALGSALLVIYLGAGLPWLVLAIAGAPALATALNGVALFGTKRPWLLPRPHKATREAAGRLLRVGGQFLALQMALAAAFASDNIVAAQVLGPVAVTDYSIPMRMFSFTPMILNMILSPLWPAYGESVARGDIEWARKTLARSILVSLLLTVPSSAFLVVFGAQIVHLWVGPAISPTLELLLGLAVWTVVGALVNTVGTFLNGVNIIRFQVISAAIMAVGALTAKITLAQAIGLHGIIWGNVIAYTLLTGIPFSILLLKLLSSGQLSVSVEHSRFAGQSQRQPLGTDGLTSGHE